MEARMREDLRIIPRQAPMPSPTARDLLAVVFRQRRLLTCSFATVFLAVLLYGVLSPSYQAHMKILLRRARPAVAPTSQTTVLDKPEVSEVEINSAVELLRDDEILKTVVQLAGLPSRPTWLDWLRGIDEPTRLARARNRLGADLTVEPLPKTTLIAVSYRSSDPEQSANVLRCLASAYLVRDTHVRRPSGEFEFFADQMTRAQKDLENSEQQLMEFNRGQGVISAALERDQAVQRLGEMETNERQTAVSIAEMTRRISSLESALRSLPNQNPDHPWARSELLKAQVELGTLKAREAAAGTVNRNYRAATAALGDRAIRQGALLRRQKTLEEQYLLYVQKREEARIADALDQQGILNVTVAEQPAVPALPLRSSFTYAGIGLALATGLSAGAAFVADRFDPAFRTPDEVVRYLGAPVLASIPRRSG